MDVRTHPLMDNLKLDLYLQTQRSLYAAGLPAKIAALEAALQAWTEDQSGDTRADALGQAHRLAGAGGTFGFPAVSRAAAEIEQLLATADSRAPQALAAALQALRAAAESPGPAAAPTNPAPSPDAAQRLMSALTAAAPTPSRLVFVVEQTLAAGQALADALGRSGYRSRLFTAPDEAIQAAGQERPAAILAHIAFCSAGWQAQRPGPLEANLPLIFVAGSTDFDTRLLAVRAGAAGYFPEPPDLPALTALLDHITSDEPARPYRVLLVDDDENLAAMYAGVLQSAGMLTKIVTDPREVMAPLVDFQPDLITCDIHMPQCSGIELAALIRQQAAFVRLPIVFLSAETSLDQQALALRQGGDDFILKPVAPAALISTAQSRARRYRSLLAAEDTLRISEERFRMVFETSLDGFIQTLTDGTVISANQSACDLFRLTEAQLKARGLAGLVDTAHQPLDQVLASDSPDGRFRGEVRCLREGGGYFPAEVSASRHTGRNGDVQVSVILRDITERKLAEQQILQLNAGLERRVEQRTAELTEANLELQAFSHSLAHDLRQPYIAINGLTHLLEREMSAGQSERGRHYLQRIRAGVNQMNERTDSLLALAQLSRAQTRREKVDLGAMAGRVLETLAQQEPGRDVQTRVGQGLWVQADATLLSHLLAIVLGNAWKFTSRSSHAAIEVGCETSPSGEQIFFVRDNGAGFDMAYADQLFKPFQRLHAPGEFAGAGVGLAMARRIVARHGGRIWAQSAPAQGACFYFTLEPSPANQAMK